MLKVCDPRSLKLEARAARILLGSPEKIPIQIVNPPLLRWAHGVIRDGETAVIFLKEFWPQMVNER